MPAGRKVWAVYAVLMEKHDHQPKIYIRRTFRGVSDDADDDDGDGRLGTVLIGKPPKKSASPASP